MEVGVTDQRITAIGQNLGDAREVMDLGGLTVLPGVIDTQVHFREPGNEHKEDLETGTKSAVAGGVTAIFEMPNTNPPTTSLDALRDKINRANERAWCDFAFFAGATIDGSGELEAMEAEPGCCGVKIFMGSSTGGLLVDNDDAIEAVLRRGTRRVAVHAEDENRLKERKELAFEGAHPRAHPIWRDAQTALLATQRILELARATRRRVHVLHITTKPEMELLAKHKDLVTVETTPQHLTLTAPDCYERLGTYAQMNPPIRDAEHQAGLWWGVNTGVVDVIGSDHAPHTKEEKDGEYPNTPSGMPGVQTLVPLMLNHVHEGRLSLERFVDLTSGSPARIYDIVGKGRIALGYDADFTIVDLQAERTITHDWMESRCGWTPFDGMNVRGWPVGTVIRGRVVMRDGQLLASHAAPVRFGSHVFR